MSKQAPGTRLDGIVNQLIEFSRGNFDVRADITDDDDELNTVVSGLNMVGEELAHYKKELGSRNTFLQNILSSIDEVIYARSVLPKLPEQSPFTFVSARSLEIIGYTAEELEAEPDKWIKAIHPEDNIYISGHLKAILSGKSTQFTYRIYHPHRQEYRWLEDSIIPEKDEQGNVIGLFGSARDITEQKLVNIELGDKNKLVSRIISSSDQFFYIVSLNPENSFINNFTYLSWQIEKIQGSTINEVLANPMAWIESIHPDDIEQLKEDNKRMFSTRQPVMRIYRTRHAKTGEYHWLEDYVMPVADETGFIKELYGSVRDITARKNAELERETLMKEIGNRFNELMQFNYIVSHNLRAPVSHILGLAKLFEMDLSEQEVKTTLKYITEAAEALDDLLQDLNTILSTRSMLNEKVEPVSLEQVLITVRSNLVHEIDKAHAKINVDIPPDADDVTSVKSFIQSAFFNLISNAIKYRHPDRRLIIAITAERKGKQTRIEVSDNGIGIDLDILGDRIFGLYSRFHDAYEGKGIGLYMTRTQIESLGGNITVKSKQGEGTTFTITL